MLSPFKPSLETHHEVFHGMAGLYVYFYELGVRMLKPGGLLGHAKQIFEEVDVLSREWSERFSVTRTALSSGGRAKRKFLPVFPLLAPYGPDC